MSLDIVIKGLANNGLIKKAVTKLSENDGKYLPVLKKHLPALSGAWITGLYILNTHNSKKISDERKLPLQINNIFCGLIGILGGYSLSPIVRTFIKSVEEKLIHQLPTMELGEQVLLKKGINSMVPLFVFAFTFRFLAPVVATPIADKVSNFLIKHGYIKDPKTHEKVNKVSMNGNKPTNNTKTGNNLDVSVVSVPINHNLDQNFEQFLNKVGFKPSSSFIG